MDLIDLKQELLIFNIIRPDDKIQHRVEAKLKPLPELRQLIIDQTHFLQYDAPLKVRIYCVILNIRRQPLCEVCDNVMKMRLDGKFRHTFPRTCGAKCHSQLSDIKEKRAKTNIEKYGVSNVLTSDRVSKIRKKKNLGNFGVENALSSPIVRDKIKKDNMEKYGVENVSGLPHVVDKRKTTMVQKYGVEHAAQSPEILAKTKATNTERYGVENVWLSEIFQKKRFVTMAKKYGVLYAIQSDEFRDKITNTMNERYGVGHGKQIHLTIESLTKAHDRNWLVEEHHTRERTISNIAAELGYSQSGLYRTFHELDIEIRRYHISTGESELYQLISTIVSQNKVIQSDRSILNGKELDVYVPEKKIAFEYNGIFWHSELVGKDKNYHLAKTTTCASKGIRLVHIWDNEWLFKQPIVISRINAFLGMSTSVYARKCIICEPSKDEIRDFMNNNHIQGNAGCSIAYGLKLENNYVAMITFGKSRYSNTAEYELIRYANVLNTSVVGGASKLFKHFIKTNDPKSVVTYSDKRWNTGEMYGTLGFEYSHASSPNYFYFHQSNGQKLLSRQTFQKHKLKDKLEIFDPLLTEWENMKNNGFNRIWDCGNDVYTWTKS